MQLRFASFAVINLRRDLHPQACARAGRTKKSGSRRSRFFVWVEARAGVEPTYTDLQSGA